MKRFLEEVSHDVLAFTRMFDYIKDIVLILEVDRDSFRHIYLNKSAEETFKLEEGFIGKRLEEVLPINQAAGLNEKFQQVQSTLKSIEFTEELLIITKNLYVNQRLVLL
ncbi:PAS domain-containing protein [Ornithinibacillus halotolerans]|uniref:PAS fold-4 domain-containing protein n=1 Tax=Ornithinibacillus halotolerans TaxID=1274357 RepID=A0A916RUN1_9BACI|nr:PAS domain-containing protein [Ornithinibacillus halotolerans]GGA71887.1 hypothetical protein GCM10008025_14630 [Ornithinibacillus halotolerans]